jgi:AraC-like DNA-binding protein
MGGARLFGKISLRTMPEEAKYEAEKLAALCQISRRQLERKFRASLGRSPQRWLNGLKILKAQELLRKGWSVKETSNGLGYRYPSYFCYQFKSICGLTPKQFLTTATAGSNPPRNVAIS